MKVLIDKSDNMYVLVRATAGQGFVIKVKDGQVLKTWNLNQASKIYEMMCFNTDETKIFVFGNDSGDIQLIDVNADAPVRIAGTGAMHTDASTYTDGTPGQPLTATLRQCEGCICAADGTIYFSEIKGTVRTFTPDENGDYSKGTISTIVGQPYVTVVKDGVGTAATFYYPAGLCLAPDGKTLYMIDGTGNGTVRKIFYK
jgi:sugar lactone lactonase YvrE